MDSSRSLHQPSPPEDETRQARPPAPWSPFARTTTATSVTRTARHTQRRYQHGQGDKEQRFHSGPILPRLVTVVVRWETRTMNLSAVDLCEGGRSAPHPTGQAPTKTKD
jgi:hypothetical protein